MLARELDAGPEMVLRVMETARQSSDPGGVIPARQRRGPLLF